MQAPNSWRVLGLMSGSSLDGLDACLARFERHGADWQYEIEKAGTTSYPAALQAELAVAHELSALQLMQLEVRLADFFVEAVRDLLANQPAPLLISTHGHTVFHQPEAGFTTQIGGASRLAARLRLPVVYDFRSADLALGGQGAPLVPFGDALLFGQHAACLNLGGIANISFARNGRRLAYDIACCNLVLNQASNLLGQPYDAGGALAAGGKVLPELLEQLRQIDFYQQPPPRSLGREHFEQILKPILFNGQYQPHDLLASWCFHLGELIGQSTRKLEGSLLITGGGAYNHFLIKQIEQHSGLEVVIPSPQLIEQKEALIFGFLGLMRYLRQPNVLPEVTGGSAGHSAGALIDLFP